MEVRPGTTLMESIMVLTSDRSAASGVLNSRAVDNVRSISSLANSSILVRYKKKNSLRQLVSSCHSSGSVKMYVAT